MGLPQTPSPPQLYSQDLQLKLYQAFIFSIPILFSIILFLLFYLFYLKKRTSFAASSSSSATLPDISNDAYSTSTLSNATTGFKGTIKEKLQVILFNEDARTRESLCCVCLGEFKVMEELHLLPLCKHFFHMECIRLWLHSNTSCPLCRCSVIISTKNRSHSETIRPNNDENIIEAISGDGIEYGAEVENQSSIADLNTSTSNICTGHDEQSSSGSGNSSIFDNGFDLQSESVVINIQTHS